jgi:glycosyltransferase involved in cell wall biosynthesis
MSLSDRLDRALTPLVRRRSFPRYRLAVDPDPSPGVNVVGYLRAELGIAEVARQIISGVEQAGIPCSTFAYGRTLSRQEHVHPVDRPDDFTAPYDTNIICVNADQLRYLRRDVGPELFGRRYSIGVWFWEVARFPERLHSAFDFVDEVWVGSDFVRAAVSAETSKPVCVVPLPIGEPPAIAVSRAELGLPDGFLFLFSFDFLSVFERKNPLAVVDAFSRAFEPGDGAALVIKSVNGDWDAPSLRRLRAAVGDRRDVHVIDRYVSSAEKNAMMAACDCYVSLHRSEGYGLTMAEAMAYGKPVIATRYSGNLEFMNDENSYLVPFRPTPIPKRCGPYPAGEGWADPDVAAAAELMRRVYDHQEEAREVGGRARAALLEQHTTERTASFIATRLDEIRPGWACD